MELSVHKQHEKMISTIWDGLYDTLYNMKCNLRHYTLDFSFPAEKTYMDSVQERVYKYDTVTFGEFYTLCMGDIVTYRVGDLVFELSVLDKPSTGEIVYRFRRICVYL